MLMRLPNQAFLVGAHYGEGAGKIKHEVIGYHRNRLTVRR